MGFREQEGVDRGEQRVELVVLVQSYHVPIKFVQEGENGERVFSGVFVELLGD